MSNSSAGSVDILITFENYAGLADRQQSVLGALRRELLAAAQKGESCLTQFARLAAYYSGLPEIRTGRDRITPTTAASRDFGAIREALRL
jgi:hypothetical protein